MERRTKLTIAYLGTRYRGWQRQPFGDTVQGALEEALAAMTGGLAAAFVGAGRTDAGVHAAGQVAHVDLPVAIPPCGLQRGLNQHLPDDIRVRDVRPVRPEFHARRSACGKLYTYRLRWREPDLPWFGLRTAIVDPIACTVDLEAALRLLPGRRDVASFTVPEATTAPTVRTLYEAHCRHLRSGLDLEFLGDGFLRYQVRRTVGALLEVALGRMTVDDFRQLLDQPRAGASLPTAPACGLTLERVFYRRSGRLRDDDRDRSTQPAHCGATPTDARGSALPNELPVVDSEPPG